MPLLLLPITPPPGAFRQWNGTTEVGLTVNGVWNGSTILALSPTVTVA